MSLSPLKWHSNRRIHNLKLNGNEKNSNTVITNGDSSPNKFAADDVAKGTIVKVQPTESLSKPPSSSSNASSPRKLKFYQIYRYADKWDILLMTTGLITALASGVSFPLIFVVYQHVVNAFVALGRNDTNYNHTTSILQGCRPLISQNNEFTSPYDEILSIIKWYPILGACCFVLYWISYTCWIIAAERQVRRIRYILFDNIMRQDIGWFDTCTSSNLSSDLLIESLDTIRDGIGFKVADFTALIARIVGSLAYAFYAGWKLTLVFISISPLIIITFNVSVIVMKKYTRKETAAYSQANAIVHEVLSAIRTVTAFGGQRRELDRYEKCLVESKRMGHKKGLLMGISQAFVYIALYGSIALIFWYGPYLARVECWNYNAGIVIIIFTSCLVSTNNISTIIPPLLEFAQTSVAGTRVFEIIDRKSLIDIADPVNKKYDLKFYGQIEFRNIVFNYPSRKEPQPILQGLNLTFAAGSTTAIVGETGCGKSTIIQLIQRFYDPEQGQVLFDGIDARHLDLKWLRSQIGVVSQEPVLFSGTIEDNIRLGNLLATDDDIRNAARLAKIDEFIESLPLKYKTPITGRDFAGGQKQRMAIARALVSNPKILLLDEATSALDTRSEREVQEALEQARYGRTTIIIAHRLSTIRMADLIIGLERGGIIHEQGTHAQLMARGGNYTRAVIAQQIVNTDSTEENEVEDNNESQQDDHAAALERHKSISSRHSVVSSTPSTTTILNDVDNDDETDLNSSKKPLFIRIFALNSHEWFSILLGSIASLIFGAVMPSFAFIFSLIFGLFSEPDPSVAEHNSHIYSVIVFFIGLAGGLCQLVSSLSFAHSGEALTVRMRVLSFGAILRQEMSWFERERNRHGILVTRLASDAAALKGMTGVTIGAFLNAIGTLIAGLIISFNAGWKLTLVLLCFTPLIIITGMVQGSTLAKAGKKRNTSTNAEVGGKYATEALQNIRTVVSLHIEDYFIKLYKEAYNREFEYSIRHSQRIVFANALANSIMFFIHTAAFGYGAQLVHTGEMSYVKVFQVFAVVTYATVAFGRSVSMIPNYSRATQAAKRIIALQARQSHIDPDAIDTGLKLETVRGELEFRHVTHCYLARPKVRVLRNLSLTCAANSQTAIVGPSGSGKSTCVALIERFYDPIRGSVHLDGHDLRTLNVKWLRSIIGIVQQEPVLFNMSIRDNIAYGDTTRKVSDLEIENAAKQANIHDTIVRLAQGYDTMCGSEGQVQLAGGQKQRIAIARVLIRQPKIVLFDEATSALDATTEKTILDALERAREGRTCVTIAHRLSTIRHSDKIAVLVRGHLDEQGTHEELMEHGEKGTYHILVKTAESSSSEH